MKEIKNKIKYLYDSKKGDEVIIVGYKDYIISCDEINTSFQIDDMKQPRHFLTYWWHDNTIETLIENSFIWGQNERD